MQYPTNRGMAATVEQQVLATLGYLASNSFQLYVGNILGFHQSTISRFVRRVTKSLCRHSGRFIHFSDEEVLHIFIFRFLKISIGTSENKMAFSTVANFPNIVRIINGTHIRFETYKNLLAENYFT